MFDPEKSLWFNVNESYKLRDFAELTGTCRACLGPYDRESGCELIPSGVCLGCMETWYER